MKTATLRPAWLRHLVRWLWIWDRHPDIIPPDEMLCVNGFMRFFLYPSCLFIGVMALLMWAA